MPNLSILGLFRNHLGRSQPDEMNFIDSMINCSNLEMLLVHENKLRGVLPPSIGNLSSQVTTLSFAGNSLYGALPSGIGNLMKLERCPFGQKFTGGVLYLSKSCTFCPLGQTQLDFLVKSSHVQGT
ncbi:putative non-specific serine/threonine protein kinase [Helianthus anomalus]